jgi:TonB family protein
MKPIFGALIFMLLFFAAKAQKRDTTIYQGCRLANDTTQYIDGTGASILDSCPQFRNGLNDLLKYISTHVHCPLNIRKDHLKGKVIISVVIEKDGSITHAKIERGISKNIDKEALRVINSLPKWKPGILNRKPVRVKYYIPVSFTVPNKNHNKT